MAGIRTAPTVSGTPNANKVSLHWIDASGEVRSDSIYLDLATTDLEVEAMAAAAAALSNASLWKITQQIVYVGAKTPSNADGGIVFEDVDSNLVFQVSDAIGSQSIRAYIPSPIQSLTMVGETEDPDPVATGVVTYLTALGAAVVTGWSVVGIRFTQRRDINNQTKI